MPARRRLGRGGPWTLALIVFLTVTCAINLQGGDGEVPPQSWQQGRGPVVPHDSFPADCSLCHVGSGWHEIRADFNFDHGKETGVPLRGAHTRAECLRCHNDRGPVKVFASKGCAGCHEDLHQGRLGRRCQSCHSERDWRPREQIARHARTRFPLIAAHAGVACWRCHPGAQVGNFQRADARCESCHQADLARAKNPDHRAQGWTTDCRRCHSPTTWSGATFSHTAFPLTGAHRQISCASCHPGSSFKGAPRACSACHLPEYNAVKNPDHRASGFSLDCRRCHGTASWKGASFDHTTYPLTGAHRPLACTACHAGNRFKGTPRVCVGCHLADYNAAKNPDHRTSKFPTTCQSCHTTSTWKGAVFNHRFPIRGPHRTACATCHPVVANGRQFTCFACHAHGKTKMDRKHAKIRGYAYLSAACVRCHPNGKE